MGLLYWQLNLNSERIMDKEIAQDILDFLEWVRKNMEVKSEDMEHYYNGLTSSQLQLLKIVNESNTSEKANDIIPDVGRIEHLKCVHFNYCKIKNKNGNCRKNCKYRNC